MVRDILTDTTGNMIYTSVTSMHNIEQYEDSIINPVLKKVNKKKKKILVHIVAYNAQKTIVNLIRRFLPTIYEQVDEILIADDCSSDKTSLLAKTFIKKNNLSKIKVTKHKDNKGYGGNQKWGYRYAIDNGYDVVVMIHGDAQYPPEFIPDLIQPIINNKKDFMFGSRMTDNPIGGGMPIYKYFGNIFLTSIENIVLGTYLSEFHSGFRAYSVNALKTIPFEKNDDAFHFDTQIIIQLVMKRKRIGEITIPTHYGDEKCNVRVITYGMNILKEMCKYILTVSHIYTYENYRLSV